MHESLEFPIRANRVIRANRANRFARITPLTDDEVLTYFTQIEERIHALDSRKALKLPARNPETGLGGGASQKKLACSYTL